MNPYEKSFCTSVVNKLKSWPLAQISIKNSNFPNFKGVREKFTNDEFSSADELFDALESVWKAVASCDGVFTYIGEEILVYLKKKRTQVKMDPMVLWNTKISTYASNLTKLLIPTSKEP